MQILIVPIAIGPIGIGFIIEDRFAEIGGSFQKIVSPSANVIHWQTFSQQQQKAANPPRIVQLIPKKETKKLDKIFQKIILLVCFIVYLYT